MNFKDLSVHVFGITAALAILAGCGGAPQARLAPSGPFQQSNAPPRLGQPGGGAVNTAGGLPSAGIVPAHYRPNPGRSWMSPDAAKTKDLLYVSNIGLNTVNVYSYPNDKQVGTLTADLSGPDGICVDNKNDIWVVNNSPVGSIPYNVVEYKHGGKTPIATLTGIILAIGCSVDPTTGDLAVTNYGIDSSGGGSVSIFAHAKGTPKVYTDSEIPHFNFCGYDPKGNLYADGTDAGQNVFHFAELPKGKKTFKNITLKGGGIYYPGMVQWDGKYVAVGDQMAGGASYVAAIYQTTGAGGKIVHETPLDSGGLEEIIGFWIQGSTVIGPNALEPASKYDKGSVGFYKYPVGGKPTKILKKGFGMPQGSAISE
jgi:hypothetical protein